jgi:D-glycero-D-manno-heptose 1,7-bisphosphate phosphatase
MKAIFFDRDGTLIVDPPDLRVDSSAELELLPDTLEALAKLSKLDFGVFLISNQAGIGEGRITRDEFTAIEDTFIKMLEPSGIKILKTYVCPHRPEDNCVCRKPKPFMILQAAKEFDIDLAESYMIGDRESDIMAGVNAGTKTILVQTGNNPVETNQATYVAPDLRAAIQYLAAQPGQA